MAAFVPLLSTILVLSGGCTTPPGSYSGQETVLLSEDNADQLAADLVPLLRAAFNPASTVFTIPAEMQRKPLGKALEDALRKAGYAVSSNLKQPQTVKIGYEVDRFGDEVIRISVIAGEAFQVSRLYDQDDDGSIEAETPFTAWKEGQPAPKRRRQKTLAQLLETPAQPMGKGKAEAPAPPAPPSTPAPAPVALAVAAQSKPAPPPAPAPTNAAPQLPEVPKVVLPETRPMPPEPPVPNPADKNTFVAIPNLENEVVITPAMFAQADSQVPDPFIQIYQPKALGHSVPLRLQAIIGAGTASAIAIVNDHEYSRGDKMEGFEVYLIQQDTLWLRKYDVYVKLPLQEAPYTIKYP